jgi:carbon storage regulator CsrA
MLVLSRRFGEKIIVTVPAGPARRIEITPLRIDSGHVKLGITAGRDVIIDREEVDIRRNAAATQQGS